jgi:DTW domain-containing protein YfiP
MHIKDCICALIPQLDLQTRVVVIMHYREWSKPTASAPLIALADPRSEIRLRGEKDVPFDHHGLVLEAHQTLLLYPAEDAQVLSRELVAQDPRPVTLVVPDGTWGQASRMVKREPALQGLPRVVLPDMGPSRYRLRHEPKHGGLGTFEAIARALRILEGEDVYQRLNAPFEAMVERTLATRGRASGLPID